MKRACLRLRCNALGAALVLLAPAALAQIQINSTPNPVGSGARALGMGAAFIAVADDATAASWNPGGLTQLERPELSLVYSNKLFGERFHSSVYPDIDGDNSVDLNSLNYFSFVYPIPKTIAGRNFVLSINYLNQYDFDREIDAGQNFKGMLAGGALLSLPRNVAYEQTGKLGSVSPAFGFELTDWFSIGAVVNIWNSKLIPTNKWDISTKETQQPFLINGVQVTPRITTLEKEEKYRDFAGVNTTVGALFKPTERLGIGVVYHSKMEADVEYSSVTRIRPGALFPIRAKRDKSITFPMAMGLGVSYRLPGDKLTLSFDVTRREWDQFIIQDPDNPVRALRKVSGISAQPKKMSPNDPTYTVRLGMEYVFVNETKPKQDILPSLRAGVFYDPEPSSNRQGGFWLPLNLGGVKGDGKVDPFYGFSLGTGMLIKDRVNIDFAYMFRMGNNARVDTFGLAETSDNVRQHYFYLSTVVYF